MRIAGEAVQRFIEQLARLAAFAQLPQDFAQVRRDLRIVFRGQCPAQEGQCLRGLAQPKIYPAHGIKHGRIVRFQLQGTANQAKSLAVAIRAIGQRIAERIERHGVVRIQLENCAQVLFGQFEIIQFDRGQRPCVEQGNAFRQPGQRLTEHVERLPVALSLAQQFHLDQPRLLDLRTPALETQAVQQIARFRQIPGLTGQDGPAQDGPGPMRSGFDPLVPLAGFLPEFQQFSQEGGVIGMPGRVLIGRHGQLVPDFDRFILFPGLAQVAAQGIQHIRILRQAGQQFQRFIQSFRLAQDFGFQQGQLDVSGRIFAGRPVVRQRLLRLSLRHGELGRPNPVAATAAQRRRLLGHGQGPLGLVEMPRQQAAGVERHGILLRRAGDIQQAIHHRPRGIRLWRRGNQHGGFLPRPARLLGGLDNRGDFGGGLIHIAALQPGHDQHLARGPFIGFELQPPAGAPDHRVPGLKRRAQSGDTLGNPGVLADRGGLEVMLKRLFIVTDRAQALGREHMEQHIRIGFVQNGLGLDLIARFGPDGFRLVRRGRCLVPVVWRTRASGCNDERKQKRCRHAPEPAESVNGRFAHQHLSVIIYVMPLCAVGISHQTAPVAIRERLAFTLEELPDALVALHARDGVDECAILSTCNRTEIYVTGAKRSMQSTIEWLHEWHELAPGQCREYLYVLDSNTAIAHLLKVAAGMDSMVLGEPQITGQAKQAWHLARELKVIGTVLDRLFQHAFACAKRVRSETGIGRNPVTLPFAALRLARQIFGEIETLNMLLIGAGEMINECATHFSSAGVSRLTFANRSLERARALAQRFSAGSIDLEAMPATLAERDVVVACTSSPVPILAADLLREVQTTRRHRPVFVLDLAVPRNVDPAAGELADIYLYTIDDLRSLVDSGQRRRSASMAEAGRIVEAQVAEFKRWLNLRSSTRTLKQLRRRAQEERDRLLARARQELAAGQDPEAVVERLGRRLANRLLHGPSVRLRQAGECADESLLAAARYYFLDEE